MKLQALKQQVLELANLTTTQQLKATYAELRSLDMRCTTSWQTALEVIQANDLRELFADIDRVSDRFDQKMSKAKRVSQDLRTIADSLEASALDLTHEANQLKQTLNRKRRTTKHAELN